MNMMLRVARQVVPKNAVRCTPFALVAATLTVVSGAFAQTSTASTPCDQSTLCKGMYAVISRRKQDEMQYLVPLVAKQLSDESLQAIREYANEYLNAQIADHISQRFGYGLSSAEENRTLDRVTDTDLKGWLFDIAKVLDSPPPITNPALTRMTDAYGMETPNFKIPFNPVKYSIEQIHQIGEKLNDMLELGSLCLNRRDDDSDGLIDALDPDCAYGTVDTPEIGDRRAAILKDKVYVRFAVRNSAAQFRTLMSAFGSQSVVGGRASDAQSNLASVLEETLFNHFNVDYNKTLSNSGMGPGGYERMIHTRMFTTFHELLKGVIQHPAMLIYLDNQSNKFDLTTLRASNQNLGRELLELHTLGLGPDRNWRGSRPLYTQQDVENSALLLTGLNVGPGMMDEMGSFSYGAEINYLAHVPDSVVVDGETKITAPKVMGRRFCLFPGSNDSSCAPTPKRIEDLRKSKERADKETLKTIMTSAIKVQLDTYLRFLSNHERTKVNICNKLVGRFVVSEWIPSGLNDIETTRANESVMEVQRTPVLDRCVAAWGKDGDLKAMYTAILTSPEVWAARNYQRMVKNPNDLVISAIRASGVTINEVTDPKEVVALGDRLKREIDYLGLPYRQWMTPTGYNERWGWLSQGYLVRWISSSFRLASYLESRSASNAERYAPIMGIPSTGALQGSDEATCRAALGGRKRYEFVRRLLGYGDVRPEGNRIKVMTENMLEKDGSAGTGENYLMVKQKIAETWGPSCVKSGLTSITASPRFLRQ